MVNNTLAITTRIYSQLFGDRRFLAVSIFFPLITFFLFKVFIQTLPVNLFTNPEGLYVTITAFIIHLTSYVLCLIVIVRERRDETLTRMFVNNFSRTEVVIGYLLGYAGLATLRQFSSCWRPILCSTCHTVWALCSPYSQSLDLIVNLNCAWDHGLQLSQD